MRVVFFALAALLLASHALAQGVTLQQAVASTVGSTPDSEGRWTGEVTADMGTPEELTVTYYRVPFPLGGDISADPNPSAAASNGQITEVDGYPYVVLNQRGEDVINTDGTASRFACHAFVFSVPIFMPSNALVVTDLDYTHQGSNGFHDVFGVVFLHDGQMTQVPGNFPHRFEGTQGDDGLGVTSYEAAFPGPSVGSSLIAGGPDFSGMTSITAYTNARPTSETNPAVDPDGERGHDNTNNGVDFDTGAFTNGIQSFFIFYWNTWPNTSGTNGQGICIRDGQFFLEAQVVGDPHMVGFMGQKFNVLGEGGSVYNLVSTPHLQYNARFNATEFVHKGKHASLIAEMGIRVGDNTVRAYFPSAESEELVLEVNGERIASDDHRMLLLSEDGEEWVMRTPGEERHVVVVTKAFHFNVHGQLHRLRHLDDGVKLVDWVSGSSAHGLLGQTADSAKVQKDSNKEYIADFDWPWFLDGSLADYVVADGIFGTEFTYNQFEAL